MASKLLFLQLKILFLSGFLCFNSTTKAQGYFQMPGSRHKLTLPFLYYRNLIIIPVSINGHGPYHFILDTGVNFMIVTNASLKKELNLTLGKPITIRGLGEGHDIQAGVVSNLDLSIGRINGSYFSAAMFPEDLMPFSSYVGMQIDGIIGNDLFRQFSVEINYQSRLMTIRDPSFTSPGKNYSVEELEVLNQRPYMKILTTLNDGEKVLLRMIVDTGAGHPLSFESGSLKALIPPSNALKARIGIGLNGPIDGLLSRIPCVKIGKESLKSIICSFPIYSSSSINKPEDGRNGNIGNGILDHFDVIFDYPAGKIFFKKTGRLKKPFEYDMSGLDLLAGGKEFNNYVVSGVDPGSPADLAGLKEQDILVLIDYVPVQNYGITELESMLRSGNGKKLHILYQRNGKFGITTLTLVRRV